MGIWRTRCPASPPCTVVVWLTWSPMKKVNKKKYWHASVEFSSFGKDILTHCCKRKSQENIWERIALAQSYTSCNCRWNMQFDNRFVVHRKYCCIAPLGCTLTLPLRFHWLHTRRLGYRWLCWDHNQNWNHTRCDNLSCLGRIDSFRSRGEHTPHHSRNSRNRYRMTNME